MNSFNKNHQPKRSNKINDHSRNKMRLNKFLSNAGITSRRKADEYIEQGLIKVNGQTVTQLGTQIQPSDIVEFKNQKVSLEKFEYVLLNKPKDYITTNFDPHNRKKAIDLIQNATSLKLFPVGRLDRNNSGLLLFTNDGALANNLMHPSYQIEKVYFVKLSKPLNKAHEYQLLNGIKLEDGKAHFDTLSYKSKKNRHSVYVKLHSGKNRIIRRMFNSLGYHVENLDRIVYAGLTKKNLPLGTWRKLSHQEIKQIKRLGQ